MKKFFTLIAVAMAALSVQAQDVEAWSVYDVAEDGTATLKPEFVADPDPAKMSVVSFATANVEGTFTSGPFKGYLADKNEPVTEIILENDNTWQGLKNQNVGTSEAPNRFYYTQGRGNPVIMDKVVCDSCFKDDVHIGFTANTNNAYYQYDGSYGLPTNGSYVTVKAKVAGRMTVSGYHHKGNRDIVVVKASDAKALVYGSEFIVSGYMEGNKNEDGSMKFFDNVRSRADFLKAYNDTAATKIEIVAKDYYMPCEMANEQGIPNTDKKGWLYLTWDAAAGETYYVFNTTTQFGLSGIQFEVSEDGGNTPAEGGMNWDFTKWSANDLANLKAEAAQYPIDQLIDPTLWRSYEKADGSKPDMGGACYWYGTSIAEGELVEMTANGVALEGLKGLKFGPLSGGSLAIAVDYASTSLGDYAGPSYLWMGGRENSFTIPGVKKGDVITMDVESHKPSDPRGVSMTMAGTAVAPTSGSETPTVKETVVWTVPADGDATFTNNNGCHIYYIKVGGTTGIFNVDASVEKTVVGYYSINGVQNSGLVKGLNIVKYSDGTAVKVMK